MLSVVTLDDIEKWNRIVKSFKNFDIYYLAEYTVPFKDYGDGEPLLFYYKTENFKAINVVMKRDIENDSNFRGKIAKGSYYDLTTPYGYGGFLVEGDSSAENLKLLDDEYTKFCKNKGIISEIVRFHPVLNNVSAVNSIYETIKLGKTVTISLTSKEDIYSNLNGNKKRWIKKAINQGVKIYWGRTPELFDEFRKMYINTMKENNAKDYYFFNNNFFQSILENMKYQVMIFYSLYKGKKISMILVLHGNNQIHHHFSASERTYHHLATTNLLMYEVACWGYENGYKNFHLGGGVGSREDSLYKFKEGFNKKSNTQFSIGKKIFDHNRYQELVEIRKLDKNFLENELFFPSYRQ